MSRKAQRQHKTLKNRFFCTFFFQPEKLSVALAVFVSAHLHRLLSPLFSICALFSTLSSPSFLYFSNGIEFNESEMQFYSKSKAIERNCCDCFSFLFVLVFHQFPPTLSFFLNDNLWLAVSRKCALNGLFER